MVDALRYPGFEPDPDFNPLDPSVIKGREADWRHYQYVRSQEEFDWRAATADRNAKRRAELTAYDGWVAPAMGYVLQPENLIGGVVVKGGFALGAARGALAAGGSTLAFETGAEALRRSFDPGITTGESVLNVGATALLGGALGAGMGALGRSRAERLASGLADEMAAAAGTSGFTTRLALGDAVLGVERLPTSGYRRVVPEGQGFRGVWIDPASKVAYVDGEQVARGFKRQAWRGYGLPDEMFPNAESWGEMLLRVEAERAARGLGLSPSITDAARTLEAEAMDAARQGFEAWRTSNRRGLNNRLAKALDRMADSPYKRVHRGAQSAEALDLADAIAADGWRQATGAAAGRTVGPSVAMQVPELTVGRSTWLFEAENAAFEKYLGYAENPRRLGLSLNKNLRSTTAAGDKAMALKEFRRKAAEAVITGERSGVEAVDDYAAAIREFYRSFELEMERLNLSRFASLRGQARGNEARIASLEATLQKPLRQETREALEKALAEAQERARMFAATSDEIPITRQRDYFTRIWSRDAIRSHPKTFKRVLMRAFARSPEGWVMKDGKLERVAFDMHPAAIERRADDFITRMLGEAEEPDELIPGTVASYARMRTLDISNKDLIGVRLHPDEGVGVADFIETDPMLVGQTYAYRMGPAIADARRFDAGQGAEKGFEAALKEARTAEEAAFAKRSGKDFAKHWAPIERDLRYLRDRVLRRVVLRPDRIDNRAVSALRDLGHLAYMGLAGISTLTDAGKLVMAHGMEAFHHAFRSLDDEMGLVKLSRQEVRQAGQGGDVAMSLAVARWAETGIDPQYASWAERALRQGVNHFFVLNGLAPMTYAMRMFDGTLRQSALMDAVLRVAGGQAAAEEIADLATQGIDRRMAKRIAAMRTAGHVQQDPKSRFFFANTDAWTDEGAKISFRAAVSSGSENTVLLASAADKPIIMDGVVHFRDGPVLARLGPKLGMRKVGSYWRAQSALLSMPFTYWNFAIAATNKVLVPNVENPSVRGMAGVAAMLGLGYVVAKLRFMVSGQPFAWENMSMADKMHRVVDLSGVGGVLPNVLSHAQRTIYATTGVNPLPWTPPGLAEPTAGQTAASVLGAPASVARSIGVGSVEAASGQGLETLSWAMPGRNFPPTRWVYEAAIDAADPNQ